MASSLASQLAQVRSHNAGRLAGGKAAQRVQAKSYLFPASVASSQDYQTLHGLALNGWDELSAEDASFNKWNDATGAADLLFGDDSKDLDRLTKTKEENAGIDDAISDLLYLIGDRLLDRSAGKCIEWLIRRFRAHEYNVETLLSAFIPFHESAEFARMLGILELKDKPHFAFLLPIQKQAVPLPSSVLLSALLAPPSTTSSSVTLRWVMGLVQRKPASSRLHSFQRHRHTVLSFWLSTIVKLCSLWSGSDDMQLRMGLTRNLNKRVESRDDDAQLLLTILLPAVLEFTSSTDVEKEASIYGSMAICAIANAFSLSFEAGSRIISSLASTSIKKAKGRTAILVAIACVVQQVTKDLISTHTNDDLRTAPKLIQPTVALKLSHLLLADLSFTNEAASYDLDPFFLQLLFGLTDAAVKGQEETHIQGAMEAILGGQKAIGDRSAVRAVSYMLEQCQEKKVSALIEVISRIRQRHPRLIEGAFKNATKDISNEKRAKLDSLMGAILAQAAGATAEGTMEEKEDAIVWLGMQDADPTSRLTSLRTLLRNVQAGKAVAKDKFVQDSLASMLSDDNADIVGALYAEHELLLQSLGVNGIVEEVQKALHHTDGDAKFSRSVTLLHIRFLAEKLIGESLASEDEQWDIWFNILWPKLLLFKKSRKSGQAYYAALAEAFSGKTLKNLNVIASRIKEVSDSVLPHINDENLAKANESLVDNLARHMATSEEADCEFLITVALPSRGDTSSSPLSSRLLALLTLGSLLRNLQAEKCERVCTKIVARLQAQDGSYGRLEDYEEQTVYEAIYSKPASERTLGKVYINLFLELAKHTPIVETHFLDSTSSGATVSRLFAIIITHLTSELRLVNLIIESLLPRMHDRALAFLASIWTASQDDQLYHNAEVRLMSLKYAHAFLNAHARSSNLSDYQTIVPAFMVALHDGEKTIRVECLSSLQTLQAIATSIDPKANGSETETIYGYDVIYGPQTAVSLSYLDLQDVREFLQGIVQARQSFVNDSEYLAPWMNHHLTVNVKEDGKKVVAHKGAIIHYLSTHILCWDNLRSRLFLLESLSGVSHERKLLTLQPLLEKSLHDPASSSALQKQLLGLYDKSVKSMIKSDSQGVWTLFKFAIEGASRQAQICAASALQSQVFSILPREKQREITLFLANLIANSAVAMPREIRTCLYTLPVQPDMIASIFSELRKTITEALLSRGQPANKRNRIDAGEQQEGPGIASLSTLTELLEATLSRKPEASTQLVAELFECARLGTELHLANISTSAEHVMQVAMSNLTILCGSMDANLTAEVLDPLRIDLLINVVKTPCRPYTFQQALDLLALIGRVSPDLLVHHSMPIFTFVGSTMLQRDDEHSFTVIERTLQSILPPVVADIQRKQSQGSQKKNGLTGRDASLSLLQAARPLLCVFTDAATHVPRHRRQNFFHLLASVMGMDDFLSPVCLLLVDRQAYKVAKQMTDDEAASALQLPLSLFERAQDAKNRKQAAIDIQFSVLAEVWNEAMRTWQHRSMDPIEMQEHVFLDCVRHIDTEHEGRKTDPIKRIIALLRFSKFAVFDNRSTFEEEREVEDEDDRKKRDSILHNIIQNAILLTRVDNVAVASASQEALDEVMTIVSVSTLKHVVNSLVHSKDALSKRSGLQIFANAMGAMMKTERRQASDFTPSVIQVCSGLFESSVEDQVIALDTLLAVCEQPESKEHSALSETLSRIGKLSLQSARQGNSLVSERALDVLRKMGETLGPRLIPKLAELVQLCKSLIKRDGLPTNEDAKHQQEGALSVFVALLRSVPTFMSSHLSGIFNLLIETPIVAKSSGAKKVLANIVKFIDAGEVLQATFDVHNAALAKAGSEDLTDVHMFALDVVQLCTRSMDKRKTTSHYKAIFRFLLECFDVRRKRMLGEKQWTKLSDEALATIEGKTVGVFVRLVFRLNETTFRPLFLRLCDWALVDLAEDENEGDNIGEQVYARQTVLYKALNALLEELGELISHYYVNVLDATIETLNNGKVLPESLWEPMLTSVKLSSKADKGTFWNQMRVDKMLTALIAQLRIQGSPALSSSAMERLLADTVCSLCATVSDENCIKTANSSLLEVARQLTTPSIYSNDRSSNQVQQQSRLASIRILDRVWRTKGCEDGLLTLVPETVPSIAELLQESDEDMQQVMNGLVSAIEEILGEGLDAYLQ
ncbi:uncharacterized protein FA14DRAFT_161451 [Meira miltonrushii]|uniref:U3 small nucleolar RNA-associated protein 10 n=1 Tax=Meira miltonrushii TaxID=1280837 RepID=A0A316VE75_9BASI|nr:uncharacterized protein FA14DRAFT_161451 [Meira miltonrushii]PWN33765.1 hypothetical protein FA14DRAFT_161451 [Meira miltonrushii]